MSPFPNWDKRFPGARTRFQKYISSAANLVSAAACPNEETDSGKNLTGN